MRNPILISRFKRLKASLSPSFVTLETGKTRVNFHNDFWDCYQGEGKNWPIAEWRVTRNYPRNTCGTHFGTCYPLVSKVPNSLIFIHSSIHSFTHSFIYFQVVWIAAWSCGMLTPFVTLMMMTMKRIEKSKFENQSCDTFSESLLIVVHLSSATSTSIRGISVYF